MPLPFTGVKIIRLEYGKAKVVVEHATQGLDLLTSLGETQRTTGEDNEQLIFEAVKIATNSINDGVTYIDHQITDGNSSQIRFMDREGGLYKSTASDVATASLKVFTAVKRLADTTH